MSRSPDPSILAGGAELLDEVGPLWQELRRHHAELAPQWSVDLQSLSFADRKAEFLNKSPGGLLVLLARRDDLTIGYCVCTISADRHGDIDSIYVSADYRSQGVGRRLISRAMTWLCEQKVKSINLDVLIGNERALKLYESLGFRTRTLRMRHVT
jgi:ribosomal protein S18 acetylase RimI-like enzyme